MRLSSSIDLYLPRELVRRSPGLWDRARQAFGADVDLSTGQARVAVEAAAIVQQMREALLRLGIDDALALVVDDTVLYSDSQGKPADLGDSMLAFAEHASVFGGKPRNLRFAVEHEEAGLHSVIELVVRGEHAADEPGARVSIGARLSDLEPKPGESAADYRRRVEPLVTDRTALEAHRRQFEAFAGRVADALRAAFPDARVVEAEPEAKVVRPAAEREAPRAEPPGSRGYDPHAYYRPNPFDGMLSGLMIGSMMSWALAPPWLLFTHPSGAPIASADQLQGHEAELAPDAADPGEGGAFDQGDVDMSDGGDVGDYGGDDLGGGDFGGGDFGGGDFGGGDF